MNSQLIHQLTNTNVTDSNLNFFTHVTLSGSERVEAETTVTSLFYLAHSKYHDYLYSKKKQLPIVLKIIARTFITIYNYLWYKIYRLSLLACLQCSSTKHISGQFWEEFLITNLYQRLVDPLLSAPITCAAVVSRSAPGYSAATLHWTQQLLRLTWSTEKKYFFYKVKV